MSFFFKHIDYDNSKSPLYFEKTDNTALYIEPSFHPVFEKSKPDAFSNPEFKNYLKSNHIKQIVIVGFNTEYCCLFNAIIGEHEGYEMIFIEDLCGTVNNEATYEMPGLDINDFVGTVLSWSDCITVCYYDEYLENI